MIVRHVGLNRELPNDFRYLNLGTFDGESELNFIASNEEKKGKYCAFRGSIESVRDCFENIRARPVPCKLEDKYFCTNSR